MSVMVTLDIECAACGAVLATVTLESHRVGPELDGRQFFCRPCQRERALDDLPGQRAARETDKILAARAEQAKAAREAWADTENDRRRERDLEWRD